MGHALIATTEITHNNTIESFNIFKTHSFVGAFYYVLD